MKANLKDAIEIAVQAHSGKKDKAGAPYILHPLRVMFGVESEAAKIVAVLHDVVEDSAITIGDLRKRGFSEDVLRGVVSVTRRKGESYAAFIKRAARNPIGRKVKIADLEDNMDLRRLKRITRKDVRRLRRYLRVWRDLMGKNRK